MKTCLVKPRYYSNKGRKAAIINTDSDRTQTHSGSIVLRKQSKEKGKKLHRFISRRAHHHSSPYQCILLHSIRVLSLPISRYVAAQYQDFVAPHINVCCCTVSGFCRSPYQCILLHSIRVLSLPISRYVAAQYQGFVAPHINVCCCTVSGFCRSSKAQIY